jgi:formylglycine-generating enzyme required for sulfatase activity
MNVPSQFESSSAVATNLSSRSSKKFVMILVVAILVCTLATMIYVWMGRVPAVPGMLYVPEGIFKAGPDAKNTQLNAFYIDESEVSNADFVEFCRATGCMPPTAPPDLPVVNITFAQAQAFAKWKGKRLPTALEWERAARGIDGDLYPWGNAADGSQANLADNKKLSSRALMPVKSFKRVPAYQMAGNAWEMIDAEVAPDDAAIAKFAALLTPAPTAQGKWIQIRGGSFQTPVADAVASKWTAIPAVYAAPDIGFRCAKSPARAN